MPFILGLGRKVECGVAWVSCSVVLFVTAVHVMNPDASLKALPPAKCSETCQPKGRSSGTWVYGYGRDDGPHMWHRKARTCAGKRQSPIDLDTTASVTRYDPRLYWWNYNRKPRKMSLENNGHSAMLKGEWRDSAEAPSVWPSTGNYSAKEENYVFDQLHFHWGRNQSVGSEHTINSMSYPLEMHVVHRKRKFRDIHEALDAGANNVLVVAVLYQVSKHENEALAPIVRSLKNVRSASSQTQVKPFELRRLLPEFSSYFLMYNGSLTMPPCSEGVSWVVKLDSSTVSPEQLREFQLLRDDKNGSLSGNYRPVQPLNGRSVWHIK